MSERIYSIQELANETGVTAHTLRYYERIGLVTSVPRTESGHRQYGISHFDKVQFIRRLRSTGMPIRQVLRYFELVEKGDSTVLERLQIMEAHKEAIEANISELEQNLEKIEYKICFYKEAIADRNFAKERN